MKTNILTGVDWADAATLDARAIHEVLATHHPGPLDTANPSFHVWHETGLAAALTEARRVSSSQGYAFVLRAYVAGFRDTHLTLSFRHPEQIAWPGFLIGWRNGVPLVCVRQSDEQSLPPPGAVLISCDGESPAVLMQRMVFPYAGNPDLEADWIACTPWLLVDRGNPFALRPTECVFEARGCRTHYRLCWRPIEAAELSALLPTAQFGPTPPFAIRHFAPDCVWVSLPTFNPTTDADAAMLREVIQQVPVFRHRRGIVFDVRGNRGGNSAWGDAIVECLFGSLAPPQDEPRPYDEWRVSHDNERFVRARIHEFRQRWPDDAATIDMLQTVADSMECSRRAGRDFCSYHEPAHGGTHTSQPSAHVVRAAVFLLTDGRCGSACLDFADRLFEAGTVHHIGQQTNADSTYGDVRSVELPGGRARLTFAMKVHRHRKRGHNVPYTPHHVWNGDIADDALLERWILYLLRELP